MYILRQRKTRKRIRDNIRRNQCSSIVISIYIFIKYLRVENLLLYFVFR